MCGIAGFNLADGDKGTVNSRLLAKCLLQQIVTRGRDATGVAWTARGEVMFMKQDVPATRFVDHLNQMPRQANNVILHTRWATQGRPEDNANNHPIVLPGIVGVHNGHINNDDELIPAEVRVGKVDSEAAFHVLSTDPDAHPTDVLTVLDGTAALAWINLKAPNTLHLARLRSSPLVFAQTHRGSLVFASTRELLERAAKAAGVKLFDYVEFAEGTYAKVRLGVVREWLPIDLPPQRLPLRSYGGSIYDWDDTTWDSWTKDDNGHWKAKATTTATTSPAPKTFLGKKDREPIEDVLARVRDTAAKRGNPRRQHRHSKASK